LNLIDATSTLLIGLSIAVFHIGAANAQPEPSDFTQHGRIANGWQFDAAIDQQGIIHLISDQYYQFDLAGKQLAAESQAQDMQQFGLAFPPALSLDPMGNAHMLVRGPGSALEGLEIRYRVRNTDGSWQQDKRNYLLGSPQKLNYVLSLAAVSDEQVVATYGAAGDNVWGKVRFWDLGDLEAASIGDWSDIWRADLNTRMRTQDGTIYFASANWFYSSDIYFSMAPAGPELFDGLLKNVTSHQAGGGSRGGPDMDIDKKGAAHLIYGAHQEVYYNQYSADGQKLYPLDQRILTELGTWHLSFGIASVGVSEDGKTILVLGLKSDGNKVAHNAKLVLTYSLDSGKTWSEQIETGRYSHGGEGRMRPRLYRYDGKFYIIYFDATLQGISLASIDIASLELQQDKSLINPIIYLLLDQH
jgi:hypothetical protein